MSSGGTPTLVAAAATLAVAAIPQERWWLHV